MTVLALAVLNAALIAVVLRLLVTTSRRPRSTALPYWPESLDLPVPGLTATRSPGRRR